ncbi:MAG: thymidylate synthase [Acidiferrobacteraceae bacterium]|nr:thymidylate synthase [Acidiferrobacteraceae bacterium]
MKQYLDIVNEVITHGTRKTNRTGVDTISRFNLNYEIDMSQGFPLLTTKEISWKNIVVENLWFLSGDTHIELLRRHGCKFWDPWADANNRVPSAYGNFWRNFPTIENDQLNFNDQIRWVLTELKHNPNSRRLVVSAWSPGNAQTSTLPPCHAFWMLNVQYTGAGEPTLCLHLTQRSCDVALGLPYNIAGYALLLMLFSKFSGIRAGTLGHTLVDAHIYTAKEGGGMEEYDHIPGLKKQLTRTPRKLPILQIDQSIKQLDDIPNLLKMDTESLTSIFQIKEYDPHPAIQFKVAV